MKEKIVKVFGEIGSSPHPYGDKMTAEWVFGVLKTKFEFRIDSSIPTACVGMEGKTPVIRINPGFIENATKDMSEIQQTAFIRGVIKHEMLHYMLKHLVFNRKYDVRISNVVQDALINAIIPEFKRLISDGVLTPVTPEDLLKNRTGDILFASSRALSEDWTWEEYYEKLEEAAKESPLPNVVRDIEHVGTMDTEAVAEIDNILEKLSEALKDAGELPGWLDREISLIRKGRKRNKLLDMVRVEAQRSISGAIACKVDTLMRPNRRYENAPGKRTAYFGARITIFVDVSGSIDNDTLTECLSVINSLAKAYGSDVDIFTYDTRITARLKYRDIKRNRLVVKGGGGTSLSSALKEIDNKLLKGSVVFVFTDGYDDCPQKEEFKGAKKIIFVLPRDHSDIFARDAAKYGKVIIDEGVKN